MTGVSTSWDSCWVLVHSFACQLLRWQRQTSVAAIWELHGKSTVITGKMEHTLVGGRLRAGRWRFAGMAPARERGIAAVFQDGRSWLPFELASMEAAILHYTSCTKSRSPPRLPRQSRRGAGALSGPSHLIVVRLPRPLQAPSSV